MKIKTISGSLYDIDNVSGVCHKYDASGECIDAFKAFYMKAIPTTVKTLGEIWDYPFSKPEVGKLLYISGRESWWLSTEVVYIEE